MMYAVLAATAALSIAVYLLVLFRAIPGAITERFGEREALPQDLGKWKVDTESDAARRAQSRGLTREVRTWLHPGGGLFHRERLVEQARLRDHSTLEIVEVEPERALRRKRHKVES